MKGEKLLFNNEIKMLKQFWIISHVDISKYEALQKQINITLA